MTNKEAQEVIKILSSITGSIVLRYEKETGIDANDHTTNERPSEAALERWLIKTYPDMDTNARIEIREDAVNNRAYWRIDPSKYS